MRTVCIYDKWSITGIISAAIAQLWYDIELENKPMIQPYGVRYALHKEIIELTKFAYEPNMRYPTDLSLYDRVIMLHTSFPARDMHSIYHQFGENFIWIDSHKCDIKSIRAYNKHNKFAGLQKPKYMCHELTWKYFFPELPDIFSLDEWNKIKTVDEAYNKIVNIFDEQCNLNR